MDENPPKDIGVGRHLFGEEEVDKQFGGCVAMLNVR